ncbi:MAG: hypothetical protein RRY53_08010, partial [Pseudoflavonifractor sp.]
GRCSWESSYFYNDSSIAKWVNIYKIAGARIAQLPITIMHSAMMHQTAPKCKGENASPGRGHKNADGYSVGVFVLL